MAKSESCPENAADRLTTASDVEQLRTLGFHDSQILALTIYLGLRVAFSTVNDALEFMIAGATTVGLGTGLFYDPLLCRKINAGVADYLRANNLRGIQDLVGSLRTG